MCFVVRLFKEQLNPIDHVHLGKPWSRESKHIAGIGNVHWNHEVRILYQIADARPPTP
jgi:hypothetical protein